VYSVLLNGCSTIGLSEKIKKVEQSLDNPSREFVKFDEKKLWKQGVKGEFVAGKLVAERSAVASDRVRIQFPGLLVSENTERILETVIGLDSHDDLQFVLSETDTSLPGVRPALGYVMLCELEVEETLAQLTPEILKQLRQLGDPFEGVVVFELCSRFDVYYGIANADFTEIDWGEAHVYVDDRLLDVVRSPLSSQLTSNFYRLGYVVTVPFDVVFSVPYFAYAILSGEYFR